MKSRAQYPSWPGAWEAYYGKVYVMPVALRVSVLSVGPGSGFLKDSARNPWVYRCSCSALAPALSLFFWFALLFAFACSTLGSFPVRVYPPTKHRASTARVWPARTAAGGR